MEIMFEGKAPKALQTAGAIVKKSTVSQYLSALSNQNKEGNILKVGIFYTINCTFGSCSVVEKVSKMDEQEESNLMNYQYTDPTSRFKMELYGYYLTFEANANYNEFQFGSIAIL